MKFLIGSLFLSVLWVFRHLAFWLPWFVMRNLLWILRFLYIYHVASLLLFSRLSVFWLFFYFLGVDLFEFIWIIEFRKFLPFFQIFFSFLSTPSGTPIVDIGPLHGTPQVSEALLTFLDSIFCCSDSLNWFIFKFADSFFCLLKSIELL